jgi:hypothetical protein
MLGHLKDSENIINFNDVLSQYFEPLSVYLGEIMEPTLAQLNTLGRLTYDLRAIKKHPIQDVFMAQGYLCLQGGREGTIYFFIAPNGAIF